MNINIGDELYGVTSVRKKVVKGTVCEIHMTEEYQYVWLRDTYGEMGCSMMPFSPKELFKTKKEAQNLAAHMLLPQSLFRLRCKCGALFMVTSRDIAWQERSLDGRAATICPVCKQEVIFKPSECMLKE